MKKRVPLFDEFIKEKAEYHFDDECLLEMARIDNPKKDTELIGEVWVYGQDRSAMSPHFHYLKKDDKDGFSIELLLSNLSICNSKPRTGVDKNKLRTWEGLTKERKSLAMWLKSDNTDIPSISNYQSIITAWNQNNRDNEISPKSREECNEIVDKMLL